MRVRVSSSFIEAFLFSAMLVAGPAWAEDKGNKYDGEAEIHVAPEDELFPDRLTEEAKSRQLYAIAGEGVAIGALQWALKKKLANAAKAGPSELDKLVSDRRAEVEKIEGRAVVDTSELDAELEDLIRKREQLTNAMAKSKGADRAADLKAEMDKVDQKISAYNSSRMKRVSALAEAKRVEMKSSLAETLKTMKENKAVRESSEGAAEIAKLEKRLAEVDSLKLGDGIMTKADHAAEMVRVRSELSAAEMLAARAKYGEFKMVRWVKAKGLHRGLQALLIVDAASRVYLMYINEQAKDPGLSPVIVPLKRLALGPNYSKDAINAAVQEELKNKDTYYQYLLSEKDKDTDRRLAAQEKVNERLADTNEKLSDQLDELRERIEGAGDAPRSDDDEGADMDRSDYSRIELIPSDETPDTNGDDKGQHENRQPATQPSTQPAPAASDRKAG